MRTKLWLGLGSLNMANIEVFAWSMLVTVMYLVRLMKQIAMRC